MKINNLGNFAQWLCEPFIENKVSELFNYTKDVYIFRPKNFSEYIGQSRVKELLSKQIEGVKKRKRIFPHTLLYGEAGKGKTTLAKIIANELKVNFVECIAGDLEELDDLKNRLSKVNGGVLFQDEIHSLPRDISEKMYPILEDFKYENFNFKPFTLIGATTEVGELLENKKPFYDRFKIKLELEDYEKEDLIKIAEQYKNNVFMNDKLTRKHYETLAENCRGNPRALIGLLESVIYFDGDIDSVLYNFGIISNGYTEKDLKLLKYISLNEKGVGLQGIASYLGTYPKNYIYEIEPFLLKNGLIMRTPKGRKITVKGLKKIEELENGNK